MESVAKAAKDPVVIYVRMARPSFKKLQDTISAVEGQRAAEVALGKIKWRSVTSSFQVPRLGGWMVGEDTNNPCQSLGNKGLSESGDMSVAGWGGEGRQCL